MVSEMEKRRYQTLMGKGPKGRIPHWEAWSNPDAESFITGVDYFEQPRACRLKMQELHPELCLPVPKSNGPIPRPRLENGPQADGEKHTVRWGDGESATFEHGEKFFKTEEDVFAFDPLTHADMRAWHHVVDNWDYSSEEALFSHFTGGAETVAAFAPEHSAASAGVYNTMFMWPMLTFGWELFLSCCLDPRFEPVMEGFAELNRRSFRAICRLPVNFVCCHDDIVMTRGPVCSREWMHRYIFPRYEEFWGMAKAAGKEVIFITDGCADEVADDVVACGARGIVTEPYTDFRRLLTRHKDLMAAGEGDNRILTFGAKEDIKAMVDRMLETSKLSGGYMMGIGNHIPWNVPAESAKYYLDLCNEYAYR